MRSLDKVVLALAALALTGCTAAANTSSAAKPLAVAVKALREQDQTAMAGAQDAADAEVTRAQAAAPNDPCAPAVRTATAVDTLVRKLNQPSMASLPDQARFLVAANFVTAPFLAMGESARPDACSPQRDDSPGAALDLVKWIAQSKDALDEVAAWRTEVRARYASEDAFRQDLDQTETLLRGNGVLVSASLAYQPSSTIDVGAMPAWARGAMGK